MIRRLCLSVDGFTLQPFHLVIRRQLSGAVSVTETGFAGELGAVCRLNTDVFLFVAVDLIMDHTACHTCRNFDRL